MKPNNAMIFINIIIVIIVKQRNDLSSTDGTKLADLIWLRPKYVKFYIYSFWISYTVNECWILEPFIRLSCSFKMMWNIMHSIFKLIQAEQ